MFINRVPDSMNNNNNNFCGIISFHIIVGFHVFAGVLFPDGDGSKRLKSNGSKRLRVIPLDVTKPNDVEAAVAQIRQSKLPLWAVVNNAGIAIGCPFDWGKDIDVYQKTFDVNVFGVVRVTNRCLPLLRQSKGRVINVASVAGRLTVPIMSHYCMAKHSVCTFYHYRLYSVS